MKTFDRDLALKYNKFYIRVSKDNKPFNFVIFRPKKTSLGVKPKLKKAEEIEILLDSAGLDVLEYDTRNQRYRIRFSKDDIQKHQRLLKEILGRTYRDFNDDISARLSKAVPKILDSIYISTEPLNSASQRNIYKLLESEHQYVMDKKPYAL